MKKPITYKDMSELYPKIKKPITYADMCILYVKNIIVNTYFYLNGKIPTEDTVNEIYQYMKSNNQL